MSGLSLYVLSRRFELPLVLKSKAIGRATDAGSQKVGSTSTLLNLYATQLTCHCCTDLK